MKPRPLSSCPGWSLTETLVALAIAGLLLSWAWPQWANARRTQFRQHAQMHLHQVAQELSWSTLIYGKRPSQLSATQTMVSGLPYRFELTTSTTNPSSPEAYVLWAYPLAEQSADSCGAMWLDHTGRKGNANPGSGLAAGAPALRSSLACWGRTP